MNEELARKQLVGMIEPNNDLGDLAGHIEWTVGATDVFLDGYFSAADLEAVAWWMRNTRRER